jgi:class 3 adenylate cyclase
MTGDADLLDVLALVSEPNQTVHGLGVAVGGRPVGVWVADNTEMYYPSTVDPGVIVDAMAEAQARIAASASLKIGMCVHSGEFYEVGGGLYGGDAETVEHLAEDFAGPGDILVTHAVTPRLGHATAAALAPRPELSVVFAPGVSTLVRARRMPELRGDDTPYPHAYPEAFFAQLRRLRQADDADAVRKQIYAAYLRERVVVFVARLRPHSSSRSLAALLDDLMNNVLVEAVITVAMRAGDHIAGLGGGLAILTFDTPGEGLEFARAVRSQFAENGIIATIGVDQGPVLFFSNPRGPSGIAGSPVNIASKLAEGAGKDGNIRITTRAASRIPSLAGAQPFQFTVSRVLLTGVEV